MIWLPGDDAKLRNAMEVMKNQLRATIRHLAVLVKAAEGQKLFIPQDAIDSLPSNAQVTFSKTSVKLDPKSERQTDGHLLEYKEPGPKLIVKQGGG